jgi:ParB/RepB/Spo0J family partition protein
MSSESTNKKKSEEKTPAPEKPVKATKPAKAGKAAPPEAATVEKEHEVEAAPVQWKERTYAPVPEADRDRILNVPLERLYVPDYDSRFVKAPVDDEFLAGLAKGQRDAVLAAPMTDPAGMYELIDGRRRYEGAVKLGWKTLRVQPWEIKGGIEEAYELSIAANNDRENLSVFENALNADRLMKKFGYTQDRAAKAMGKTGAYVSQLLSMLRLPSEILDMIKDGRFGREHGANILGKARALCRLKDPLQQKRVAILACREGAQVIIDCVRVYCAATAKDADKDALFGKATLDPRVAEMALYGDLEPRTLRRCQSIAKLRAFDAQYEMACVLAERTLKAVEAGEEPPSIEQLDEWIEDVRRHLAAGPSGEEEEEEKDTDRLEFKPLSPAALRDRYEELRVKFTKYAKSDGADELRIARNAGILRGIKIAGGLA